MKSKFHQFFLTFIIGALSLLHSTSLAQVSDNPGDVSMNRAIATSPRVLEQFPELLRAALSSKKAGGSLPGSPVVKNRAMMANPRTLEEFPWLARREAVDGN